VSTKIEFLQHLITLIYLRVIYAAKKVLWTLHKKLRPILVFQQGKDDAKIGSADTNLWIKQVSDMGKGFLPSIFSYMIEEYKSCKTRYNDLRFLVNAIYAKLDNFYKHKRSLVSTLNAQLAETLRKENLTGL